MARCSSEANWFCSCLNHLKNPMLPFNIFKTDRRGTPLLLLLIAHSELEKCGTLRSEIQIAITLHHNQTYIQTFSWFAVRFWLASILLSTAVNFFSHAIEMVCIFHDLLLAGWKNAETLCLFRTAGGCIHHIFDIECVYQRVRNPIYTPSYICMPLKAHTPNEQDVNAREQQIILAKLLVNERMSNVNRRVG